LKLQQRLSLVLAIQWSWEAIPLYVAISQRLLSEVLFLSCFSISFPWPYITSFYFPGSWCSCFSIRWHGCLDNLSLLSSRWAVHYWWHSLCCRVWQVIYAGSLCNAFKYKLTHNIIIVQQYLTDWFLLERLSSPRMHLLAIHLPISNRYCCGTVCLVKWRATILEILYYLNI
jgi:hypothetical protein